MAKATTNVVSNVEVVLTMTEREAQVLSAALQGAWGSDVAPELAELRGALGGHAWNSFNPFVEDARAPGKIIKKS